MGVEGWNLLPRHAPRYSPSLLHNDICNQAVSIRLGLNERVAVDTDVERVCDLLLRGSDVELARESSLSRAIALKQLAMRLRDELLAHGSNIDARETRAFAWAAVRVASIYTQHPCDRMFVQQPK